MERKIRLVFLLGLLSLNGPIPGKTEGTPNAWEELLFMEMPQVSIAWLMEQKLTEAPANVHAVTGEEMRKRGYRDVSDLIRDLPGTTDTSYFLMTPNVRGLAIGDSAAVKFSILLNGMPLSSRTGIGHRNTNLCPVESVDRVEFLVGPYASFYGRNSLTGTINIITKKPADNSLGSAHLLYGKDQQGAATAYLGKEWKDFQANLTVMKDKSLDNRGRDLTEEYPDIYGLDARKREAAKIAGFSSNVPADFVLPWDENLLILQASHAAGLSLDTRLMAFQIPKVGQQFNPYIYYSNGDTPAKGRTMDSRVRYEYGLGGRFSGATSFYNQNMWYAERNGYLNDTEKWFVNSAQSYQGKQELRWESPQRWNNVYLSASYESVQEHPVTGSTRQKGALRPTHSAMGLNKDWYINLTLQDSLKVLDKLRAIPGVMYEHANAYKEVFLPRFAVVWDPAAGTTLKFLYATGYSPPNPIVRADQFIGLGGIKGTKSVKPERLETFDVNLMQRLTPSIQATASVYVNVMKDLIQQVSAPALPAGFTTTWTNKGTRVSRGGDFGLTGNAGPVSGFLQYGYVTGSYDTVTAAGRIIKNEGLTVAPRHQVKGGAHVPLLKKKLNFYVHDMYVGKQRTAIGGLGMLGGYNLVDVHVMTLPAFHDRLTLSLGVTNVFNRRAQDAATGPYPVWFDQVVRTRAWTTQAGWKF